MKAAATSTSEAAISAARTDGSRRRPRSLSTALSVCAIALLVATRALLVEPMQIASDSMAPTLTAGDHVLIDKLTYRSVDPRPGDLAAFQEADSSRVLLKRVVALGGDTVAIEDGRLVVNGKRTVEPYVDSRTVDSVYFGPMTVQPGKVFVLGDNRANSIDSRSFGAIPASRLIGRVVTRLWPPKRWGSLS